MSCLHLKEATTLKISGEDSRRYCNARLSNDIASLPAGKSCLAACLTIQGKTEALFQVLCLQDNSFLLVCDGGNREEIVTSFKRFIVADRVVIDDLSKDKILLHTASKDIQQLMPELFPINKLPREGELTSLQGIIVLARYRISCPGFDLLIDSDQHRIIEAMLNRCGPLLSDEEYTCERISGNRPAFPFEINKNRMFLESGLMEAISQTKGCYAGQEVIEKVLSHGKSPKVLSRIKIESNKRVAYGENLMETTNSGKENKIGEVISSAYSHQNHCCYAFVSVRNSKTDPGSTIAVNGNSAVFL